jgi:hypothetical protein
MEDEYYDGEVDEEEGELEQWEEDGEMIDNAISGAVEDPSSDSDSEIQDFEELDQFDDEDEYDSEVGMDQSLMSDGDQMDDNDMSQDQYAERYLDRTVSTMERYSMDEEDSQNSMNSRVRSIGNNPDFNFNGRFGDPERVINMSRIQEQFNGADLRNMNPAEYSQIENTI